MKRCEYAYTEITSYGVELFLDLHEITGNPLYLETSRVAGDWIIKMQNDGEDIDADGSFSLGYQLPRGPKFTRSYAFDAGICIGALVKLYKKTGVNRYLEAAIRGSNWLLTLKTDEGQLNPFYDRRKEFNPSTRKPYLLPNLRMRRDWFEKPGCHHGKAVIGLLKLHSVTKSDSLLNFIKELCRWTMSQQDESGGFQANPRIRSVFTHTHCYAIEGLLFAYGYLGDSILLKSALKGISWLVRMQKSYGTIFDWVHDGKISGSIDSSAVAQFARIIYLLDALDKNEAYQDIYADVVHALLKMQCTETKDLDSTGGFYLFEKDFKLFRFKLPRLYSWPTMFAISALTLPYYVKKRTLLDLW